MIAYMHTPEFNMVIGTDHIPRISEKIRISPISELPDERDGLFQVIDVIYEVPNSLGRQRIDIYAQRVGDAPTKLTYDAVMNQLYEAALKRLGK